MSAATNNRTQMSLLSWLTPPLPPLRAPRARDGVQHGSPLVLFSGVQHGPLTENTTQCGVSKASANASEYNPYDDYSFTLAQVCHHDVAQAVGTGLTP